jgi:alkylhydroperoxidase/carboxymuconolactone decarboxylase family protein YurZ
MIKITFSIIITIFIVLLTSKSVNAHNATFQTDTLNAKQKSISAISAFTAKGDLKKLQKALSDGLDNGLTINEVKEVLVHLYAYCGFPRSISGLNTFIAVLNERKEKGIQDVTGRNASPVSDSLSKYERGKKVLETLSGRPENPVKSGYAAFSPETEVFLKEHLFADIFGRDVLNYQERELTTISALISMGGVEPMMRSHMMIGLNIGLSENQLMQVLSIIETSVGKAAADAGRKVLNDIKASKA